MIICNECIYYSRVSAAHGVCRINPPVLVDLASHRTIDGYTQPLVAADDWCGFACEELLTDVESELRPYLDDLPPCIGDRKSSQTEPTQKKRRGRK